MQSFFKSRRVIVGAAVILILAVLAGGVWVFLNKNNLKQASNSPSPTQDPATDSADIVSKVASLIDLPAGETPSLARITDSDKVKTEKFLQNSQNGDVVLVYENAKKAVLYRPSANKVIEVASLKEEASASASISQVKNITILNGTDKTGLAGRFEPKLKAVVPEARINKGNAAVATHEKSLIVVLNKDVLAAGDLIAKELKMEIGLLPGSEKPSGDILIILGKDQI